MTASRGWSRRASITCLLAWLGPQAGSRIAAAQPAPELPATAPAPRSTLAGARAAYVAVRRELERRYPQRPMEASDFQALVESAWREVGSWVSLFLDAHPGATAEAVFAAAMSELNARDSDDLGDVALEESRYDLHATALRLDGDSPAYVVAADFGNCGTFFVVGREAHGPYRMLWDVKRAAAQHAAAGDQLAYWAYYGSAWGDGPLVGQVWPLPIDAHGRPRFYVSAYAAALAGGTSSFQLSIWSWDGREARPLLAEGYLASFDTPRGVAFDGSVLRVATKESFKTFYSCGQCAEPVGDWRVRVTPEGVEDLGRRHVVPELQLADELYDRLGRGESAAELATPAVIAALTEEMGEDLRGMLMGWSLHRKGEAAELCLSILDGAGTYVFTIVQRHGRPYVTGVRPVNSLCKD